MNKSKKKSKQILPRAHRFEDIKPMCIFTLTLKHFSALARFLEMFAFVQHKIVFPSS